MFAIFTKLLKNEDGATAIEYGLIADLIAVAAVTVLGTVGTNLTATFSTVPTKLEAFVVGQFPTTPGGARGRCRASFFCAHSVPDA